jgi:hypothetical protein
VVVCAAVDQQEFPGIVADGAGGAVVTWVDFRTSTWDMYAQRVNSGGAVLWTADGIAFCLSHNVDYTSSIPTAGDGSGGVLVGWLDHRTSAGVYAARVNPAGITGPSPVEVGEVVAVAVDGAVELSWSAWMDRAPAFHVFRSESASGPFLDLEALVEPADGPAAFRALDLSAQAGREYCYRVGWKEDGTWEWSGLARVAVPAAAPGLRAVSPNPARGAVRIDYVPAAGAPARLEICDVAGRCVRVLADGPAGAGLRSATWDGRLQGGREAAAGIYFVRLTVGARAFTKRIVLLK